MVLFGVGGASQAATVLTRFLLEDQLQFRLQEVSCLQVSWLPMFRVV